MKQLFFTSLHLKGRTCVLPFILTIFISQMEKCKNILLHRAFTFELKCNFNVLHTLWEIVSIAKYLIKIFIKKSKLLITLCDDQYAFCISCLYMDLNRQSAKHFFAFLVLGEMVGTASCEEAGKTGPILYKQPKLQ